MLDGQEVAEHAEPTTEEIRTEELSEETVDDIEDRIVTALQRSEQLETRLAECEQRLGELETSRPISEPRDANDTGNSLDTTRPPDTPPRAHTPIADWYFRRIGE